MPSRWYNTPIEPIPGAPLGHTAPRLVTMYERRPFTGFYTVSAPGAAFALVLLETEDHADAVNDPLNDALPVLTLDAPLGSNWNQSLRAKLGARPVDTSRINANTSMRALLREIATAVGPTRFDENSAFARASPNLPA